MDLRKKLINIKKKKSENQVNWERIKEEWKGDVNEFYENLLVWFNDLIKDDLIKIRLIPKKMKEEHIGEY